VPFYAPQILQWLTWDRTPNFAEIVDENVGLVIDTTAPEA